MAACKRIPAGRRSSRRVSAQGSLDLPLHAQQLLLLLSRFPDAVRDAADKYEPSRVTRATTELAKAYNKFYYEHRVLDEADAAGTKARLLLTEAVRNVIRTGLYLIGVEAPERM